MRPHQTPIDKLQMSNDASRSRFRSALARNVEIDDDDDEKRGGGSDEDGLKMGKKTCCKMSSRESFSGIPTGENFASTSLSKYSINNILVDSSLHKTTGTK